MRDTARDVGALVRERYAGVGPSQRALMALQMFETAQRVVLSSLPPSLDAYERKRELCRRFYGSELADKAFPRK
jgi:hypothetical protein